MNDVLLIAASMVGGFIFAALLTDGNVDDDDNGPGGGLMQPAYVPSPSPLTNTTKYLTIGEQFKCSLFLCLRLFWH